MSGEANNEMGQGGTSPLDCEYAWMEDDAIVFFPPRKKMTCVCIPKHKYDKKQAEYKKLKAECATLIEERDCYNAALKDIIENSAKSVPAYLTRCKLNDVHDIARAAVERR